MDRALSRLLLPLVATASLAGCSSPTTEGASTAAASTSAIPMIKLTDKRFGPPRVGHRKSGAGAKIAPSSLPVAEDFESEFRKQITSSNYLDALNSAAAEASAAPSAHP